MGLDLRENIRMAMEGLRANKMRSLLTMLGIIIGIGSVIGILTVGEGLSSTITGEMAALGAQNISVYFQERVDDYGDNLLASMTSWWIDEEDIEVLAVYDGEGDEDKEAARLLARMLH